MTRPDPLCRTVPAVLMLAGIAACGPDDLAVPDAVPVEVPAAPGAALPNAAPSSRGVILSWVEPADSGHALRFAEWNGSEWSGVRTVAAGQQWFVNWADFPSVIELDEQRLAAHWLQRSGAGSYAYDVVVARSRDRGATWSPPVRPHTDGTETEHGFVSMFPAANGTLGIVWLDGRRYAGTDTVPTNEMTVRFAALADTPDDGELLDGRACDCCQTDVAITATGPIAVYRDRSDREVRDIAIVRRVNGAWTEPQRVHADDWVIDACPVNGPQVDAVGNDVVVAWFTAARDTPRVHVAFSDDAGESFAAPIRIDGGNPIGRVDVVMLEDDRALVVWLERVEQGAELQARIVTAAGRAGDARAVAETVAQRPSGFPRMARLDGGVLLAWTEPGDTSHVRAAVLELEPR